VAEKEATDTSGEKFEYQAEVGLFIIWWKLGSFRFCELGLGFSCVVFLLWFQFDQVKNTLFLLDNYWCLCNFLAVYGVPNIVIMKALPKMDALLVFIVVTIGFYMLLSLELKFLSIRPWKLGISILSGQSALGFDSSQSVQPQGSFP
jgi:hypothetical protein